MKLEFGQIVDGKTRDYFNKLEMENAGLKEYSESRDQSISVYRQMVKDLEKEIVELKAELQKRDMQNNL